jgi:hypothetical protein
MRLHFTQCARTCIISSMSNVEQRCVFEQIYHAIQSYESSLSFVEGRPGLFGETIILRIASTRNGDIVSIVSSSAPCTTSYERSVQLTTCSEYLSLMTLLIFTTIFTARRPHSRSNSYYVRWRVNRKQLPLRLAYVTTFNSCQGLMLSRTVLDLRTDSFCSWSIMYHIVPHQKPSRYTVTIFRIK